MSERNEELFRAVADYIEEHPERYSQTTYGYTTGCDTVACIAGTALLLSGLTLQPDGDDWLWFNGTFIVDTRTKAQHLLGLTVGESYLLFSGSWEPAKHLSVADALRKIGAGADLKEVTKMDTPVNYNYFPNL